MPLYRSTINLPGCPVGMTAEFPDDARTAIFVSRGILQPVVAAIMDVFPKIVETKPTLRPTPIPRPAVVEAVEETLVVTEGAEEGVTAEVVKPQAVKKKAQRGRQGQRGGVDPA